MLTLKYPGDIFVFVADAAAKHKALQMQHWSGFQAPAPWQINSNATLKNSKKQWALGSNSQDQCKREFIQNKDLVNNGQNKSQA